MVDYATKSKELAGRFVDALIKTDGVVIRDQDRQVLVDRIGILCRVMVLATMMLRPNHRLVADMVLALLPKPVPEPLRQGPGPERRVR